MRCRPLLSCSRQVRLSQTRCTSLEPPEQRRLSIQLQITSGKLDTVWSPLGCARHSLERACFHMRFCDVQELQLQAAQAERRPSSIPSGCGSKRNQQESDRRFWSMFPLTRATHFGVTLFVTHSQVTTKDLDSLRGGADLRGKGFLLCPVGDSAIQKTASPLMVDGQPNCCQPWSVNA